MMLSYGTTIKNAVHARGNMRTEKQGQRGFSLVELSIVLVILGLLVGGILGGQALIHAAELRRVHTDVEVYTATVNAFRTKYFHFPGDMPNATRFWGVHSTLCPSETGDADADGACNGDGDGRVESSGDFGEHTFFWNHLSKAGLAPGNYGMDWTSGVTMGEHVPVSAFANASYRPAYYVRRGPTDTWFFEGLEGHNFRYGVPNNGECNSCFNSIPGLGAADAWSIDMKMDDGKPGMGRVQTAHGEYGTVPTYCTDTNDSAAAATAEYDVSGYTGNCLLIFVFD